MAGNLVDGGKDLISLIISSKNSLSGERSGNTGAKGELRRHEKVAKSWRGLDADSSKTEDGLGLGRDKDKEDLIDEDEVYRDSLHTYICAFTVT